MDAHADVLILDCDACPGRGSSACVDCVVTHLVANDQGPIQFVPMGRPPSTDEVVGWFVEAGLVDDPPAFVETDAQPEVAAPVR